MSKPNDGGPAFPKPCDECSHIEANPACGAAQEGMSLRDWFAGQALTAGLIGAARSEFGFAEPDDGIADWAYNIADAMLAEREKKGNDDGTAPQA